jgi:hypothetical protein
MSAGCRESFLIMVILPLSSLPAKLPMDRIDTCICCRLIKNFSSTESSQCFQSALASCPMLLFKVSYCSRLC